MLDQYLTLTRALLQAPSSPTPLIPDATLTTYINNSRTQVAAQGGCIRVYGTLDLVTGTRQYGFGAVVDLSAGVTGIYHIRQLWYEVPGTEPVGLLRVTSRPFEFFGLYALNTATPGSGPPAQWSQFGQGEAGTLFIDPLPDLDYVCKVDVLGVPITLVDDTTTEAIPQIWTLAVPYYAAWFGFLSLQRVADADMMLKRFQEQMTLARNAANPDLLMENWSQSPNPTMTNQLGVTRAAG